MLENKSIWVLMAMALVALSVPVAVLGYVPTALYFVGLAVVSMQVGAREE